jgi:hypothetical protein
MTQCNQANGYCIPLFPSSGWNTEVAFSSKTPVITYLAVRCHKPGVHGMNLQCCKNFKSLTLVFWRGPVQISGGFQLPWVCSWFSRVSSGQFWDNTFFKFYSSFMITFPFLFYNCRFLLMANITTNQLTHSFKSINCHVHMENQYNVLTLVLSPDQWHNG